MRAKRIVFIVLGWVFIFINTVAYLAIIDKPEPVFEKESIPFILGYNFWFLAGIAFLRLANKQKRKAQRAKEKEVLDNFLVSSDES